MYLIYGKSSDTAAIVLLKAFIKCLTSLFPPAPILFMPTYIVSLRLPDSFSEEFIALIPQHRILINQLLSEHIVEAYAISADRSRGWLTINSEDESGVEILLRKLPLYNYFSGVEIDELFIFDSVATRFPHISLN